MSSTRSLSIRCALLAALITTLLDTAHADLKDEAIDRCMLEVGEFGSGKEHAAEVARCRQRLGDQNAVKIKECVDGELNSGGKQ